MSTIDRVNIGWLLTGVGAPYEVLPPPHWDRLALGREVTYYLFASNGGLQLPLVQVCRSVGAYPQVRVYSGLPVDFADILEYLHRSHQPLYFAPDHPKLVDLRRGWGSNRLLLGDENSDGILPEPSVYIDLSPKLPELTPEPTPQEPEREWVWKLRGLDEDTRRLVLELVKRLEKRG